MLLVLLQYIDTPQRTKTQGNGGDYQKTEKDLDIWKLHGSLVWAPVLLHREIQCYSGTSWTLKTDGFDQIIVATILTFYIPFMVISDKVIITMFSSNKICSALSSYLFSCRTCPLNSLVL